MENDTCRPGREEIYVVELTIYGVRRIKETEARELTGKTPQEMEASEFFRELFPSAGGNARYWYFCGHEMIDRYSSILPLMTPVVNAEGETGYVVWMERLGYYWYKNGQHRERIGALLDEVRPLLEWDQVYHVVPYGLASRYIDNDPAVMDESEEIIAFLYG